MWIIWLIGTVAVLLVAGGIALLIFLRMRKRGGEEAFALSDRPAVLIEAVTEAEFEKSGAVESPGKALFGAIGTALPVAAQAFSSASDLAGGGVYRIVIPKGAQLAEPQGGALRAFFREGGEQAAELTKVNVALPALLDLAAVAVRQLYLIQINREMKAIRRSLDELSSFHEEELFGKVLALIVQIHTMSETEVQNCRGEERQRMLIRLDGLQQETIALLGQANLTLKRETASVLSDYREYERKVAAVQRTFFLRNALYEVLSSVCDFRYALRAGEISVAQSRAVLRLYTAQCLEAQESLAAWHAGCAEKLGIDLGNRLRKRKGLDRAKTFFPALFKKEKKFRPLDEGMAQTIEEQMGWQPPASRPDLYGRDTELYVRDGKVYLLPEEAS